MLKILIIDNEISISKLVEVELVQAGYKAAAESDAEAAIAAMEADPFINVLFTDAVLSEAMNGLQLALYVRDRWPRIQIIIGSNRGRPLPHEMPFGCTFLTKPYGRGNVAAAVGRLQAA